MKSSHRLIPVETFAEQSWGVGHVDKAEGFRLALFAIKRDFCAAQGTGAIKVNDRSNLIRHREEISSFSAKPLLIRPEPELGIIMR
jgi:hypothetical protein